MTTTVKTLQEEIDRAFISLTLALSSCVLLNCDRSNEFSSVLQAVKNAQSEIAAYVTYQDGSVTR